MENLITNEKFNYEIYDKYICQQNIDRIKYYLNKEKNPNINALSAGYHLNKENQKKTGGIFFFNIDENQNKIKHIKEEDILLDYGILDIKIINNNNLITANSDYSYSIINFDNKNYKITKYLLSEDNKLSTITNDILEIYKDFSKIISGTNDGNIYINDLNKTSNFAKIEKAHDYGIWSLHLLNNNENTLLSGAEDAKIKIWDLRCDNTKDNLFDLKKESNKNTYNSSINYIDELKFDLSGNTIITGSYDEKIVLFDIRKFPNELKTIKTEHSCWDMKQYKIKENNLIFISSIYEGFNIWSIDTTLNMEHLLRLPVTKNEDIFHKTIVYGLDVKVSKNDSAEILSCSFYDNLIMYWKYNIL